MEKSKKPEPTAATRGCARGASGCDIEVGFLVVLEGLQSAEYNGKRGTIKSLPASGQKDGRYGVLVDGKDKPVAIRRANVVLISTNPKSTEEKLREREMFSFGEHAKQMKRTPVNNEQLLNMAGLMEVYLSMQNKSDKKTEPLPDFRRELFHQDAGLPTGINEKWAFDYLDTVWKQCCNLPHLAESEIKAPNFTPNELDFYKRLNSNHPKKVEWYCEPPSPGDVFPVDTIVDDERTVYGSLVRQSFSNSVYLKEALYKGTTHVAVGFVDLGMLFAASLQEPPDGQSGPLHFLGIDMCPCVVAKTLVIWEMLKQTPRTLQKRKDHIRSVAQVWFSTTWSETTGDAVKTALVSLFARSRKPYHPEVDRLLQHWLDAPLISLEEARKHHCMTSNDDFSSIPYLKRKSDRIAQAKYELTGDFALGGEPCYGNTLRFDCPDGTAPLDTNETIFTVLSFEDITETLSPSVSTLEAAERIVLANVSKMADWAVAGDVSVELVCAKIQDKLEDVIAARPWTMSWSNVLDYMKHSDFHRMARACSAHGETVHFAYSMNWTNSVFGTYIIDYYNAKERSSFIDAANYTMRRIYQSYGWSDYLRLPRPTHPINTTCQFALELFNHPKWLKYFFGVARKRGPCKMGNFEHGFGSPLSHTGATQSVAFTWTYDPEVWFIPREMPSGIK